MQSRSEQFLSRNMTITQFAAEAHTPVTTLRDWNKTGASAGIGQPGPNGHWLYSRADGLAIRLARKFKEQQNFPWEVAIEMGRVATDHFVGQHLYSSMSATPDSGHYGQRFVVFYPGSESAKPLSYACDDLSATVSYLVEDYHDAARPAPVFWVVDLNDVFSNLPGVDQCTLEELVA